ncbi:MAG: decarboxylase [Desulfurococcaceae archaeon]
MSRRIYGIENYARGEILAVDNEGYLALVLNGHKIRLKEIMDMHNLDVAYIRVLPAIKRSMAITHEAFKLVSNAMNFHGRFTPIFPMKVNSVPMVIESIMRFGEEYNWGFNAGSIGEVRLLQGIAVKYSPRTLVYDGVVTDNAIEELLKLHRIGWRVIVDIESLSEAEIISRYPQLEVGIRVKPLVKMHGKWSGSIGVGGKFGLTTNTIARLKEEFKWILDRATLLHMHPGSQIYKLKDIKNYFDEVRNVYDQLKSAGFEKISSIDPGGGMGYPYLDIRDGDEESPDYTIVDYYRELINQFRDMEHPPDIIYEGGRFIVTSHRIVVAKVIDVRPYSAVHTPTYSQEITKDINNIEDVKKLLDHLEASLSRMRAESHGFDNGKRELYENLVAILREDLSTKIAELLVNGKTNTEELLADKRILKVLTTPTKRFILNMSIFADIPDAVLVDQYFQVVPVQRLDEQPSVLASLSDLTCDSMGEISLYISPGNTSPGDSPLFTTMDNKLILLPGVKLKLRGVPLHLPTRGENYYVAFLDTGSYQDMLAMKHNLIYGAPEIIVDYVNGEVSIKLIKHEDLYQSYHL